MDISSVLKKIYPEGSYGPGTGSLKGECVVFCQHIVQFPASTGNYLWNKKNFVNKYGIRKDNLSDDYRIGDVVFTSESLIYGHAAIITWVDFPNRRFTVSESNFKAKKRVSHGRFMSFDSPKIIGIGRFPFKINIGLNFPIKLKVSILMNNFKKQWNPKCFTELQEWFKTSSNGRIELDIHPLYVNLKNWFYGNYGAGIDGAQFKVINDEWYKEHVLSVPNAFQNEPAHITVFVVNKKEWEGSVLNQPGVQEIGWYMPRTNPARIQVACDESDLSPYYFGKQLFQDAIEHEILHYLAYMGNAQYFDYLHIYHSQRKMERLFDEGGFDYQKVYVSL
jgi:hypothetical protein